MIIISFEEKQNERRARCVTVWKRRLENAHQEYDDNELEMKSAFDDLMKGDRTARELISLLREKRWALIELIEGCYGALAFLQADADRVVSRAAELQGRGG